MAGSVIDSQSIVTGIEHVVFNAVLNDIGNEGMAIKAVRSTLECLYINFRGQVIYIPNKYHNQKSDRHSAIYAEFNGLNHKQLAVKYGVSTKCIYEVVKKMRTKAINERQQQLFELDEAEERPILIQVLDDYVPAELARSGINQDMARLISSNIAGYLMDQYPGILFTFSKQLYDAKNCVDNHDLFEI
ncbi:MAG: hypothetical protein CTY18_02950 [Methylomonas sp.]|nr:MAG: hypothetical protein CTY18_02950 [Methylomonas sp.]